jgi:hypothetical protein
MPENDEAPPRPRLGAAWWVAMALSLALILAGAAVGLLGPRLFPPHPSTPPAGLATRPGAAK